MARMSTRGKATCCQALRRVLCCGPPQDPPAADPINMHSIVIPSSPPPPEPAKFTNTAEIRWHSDKDRETLMATAKSEPPKELMSTLRSFAKEENLEAMLRALDDADGGDTMRNPVQSYFEEQDLQPAQSPSNFHIQEENDSGGSVRGLKYLELPSPTPPDRLPAPSKPFVLPLKPITPSVYRGKTRIPTAKPKHGDARVRSTSPL